MSSIKKTLLLVLALIPFLVLTACSVKTETSSFQNFNDAGFDSRLVYHHQKDKVVKQTTQNTITYSFLGAKNKDEAKTAIASLTDSSAYENLKGVTYKIEYKDDRVVEKISVDYEKADLKEVAPVVGMSASEAEKVDYISLKESTKMLKSAKYAAVKNDDFKELP